MQRPPALLACLALVLAALGSFLPAAPARAGQGLVLSSHTRYEVRPADRIIVVTVDIAATNVVADTAAGRTYFTGISVPIPASATNVSAVGGGVGLGVSLEPIDEFTKFADITFSTGVFHRQTYNTRLSFVISDGGGEPTRETWVRQSFVAFGAWPIGSDGDASIEVVLPSGYEATDHMDRLEVTDDGTATRLTANGIDPSTFFTYVIAEKESERTETTLEVPFANLSGEVIVSAWPDDPDWGTRVGGWLRDGLPLLEDAIGLDYPVTTRPLRVDEHAYNHLGDYAGYFISTLDTIAIRFDADAFVTLHEAAHIWFEGTLVDERWLLEGFASYYAEQVATQIGLEIDAYELTDEMRADAFPLTEWGEPGNEDLEREDYGYAASVEAAQAIAELAGTEGLQKVWVAVLDERRAYALENDELLEDGEQRVNDWKRLLDLFEIETGADFGPIWVEWVIDDRDAALLDDRAAARAEYAETVTALDGWRVPESTRMAMEWWRFDDATAEMASIHEVVADRAELEADAAALDLEPTDDLRRAFEDEGIAAAAAEADDQAEALAAIAEAGSIVAEARSALEEVGLLWEADPAIHVADARDAYEDGDDAGAVEAAAAAVTDREALEDRGRTRVILAGGGILGLDALAMAALFAARRRRRSTAVDPPAAAAPPPATA
ncbi:MAG TPA: hypothetical protein VHR55_12010 [Candidatus Limnocylindria bacterium]|nr:hypothetical protein [Candidatus Limnocylindria bacterium]